MLTELEKKAIAAIQGDLPVTDRPYRGIAGKLAIPEETFLRVLNDLCARGIIRRFGATLRHQKSGFAANAMCAWTIDEKHIDETGKKLAMFKEVSHCYRRNPTDAWPYNLYTMIHAKNENACREIAKKMSAAVSVNTYTLLFSREELKKTSMQYFTSD